MFARSGGHLRGVGRSVRQHHLQSLRRSRRDHLGGHDGRTRPVPTVPVRTSFDEAGLASDASYPYVGATDGSVWLAAREGLTRWKDGQFTTFRTTSGLPDDAMQSLFEDPRGRIWVFTKGGLAYFDGSRFVAVPGVPARRCSPYRGRGGQSVALGECGD